MFMLLTRRRAAAAFVRTRVNASSLAPRVPAHLGICATLSAILGFSIAFALGCDPPTCLAAGGLLAVTVRIALIDLSHRVILNREVVAMGVIGCTWTLFYTADPAMGLYQGLLQAFLYAAAFQAIRLAYRHLRRREGLGFGDVKLIAAAGPLLKIDVFAFVIVSAALGGIAFVLMRACLKGRRPSRYTYVPLGSALAITIYGAWLIRVGFL